MLVSRRWDLRGCAARTSLRAWAGTRPRSGASWAADAAPAARTGLRLRRLRRSGGRGGQGSQAGSNRGLAGRVRYRLKRGWSPHSVSADLAAEATRVCAGTIYRAAYSGCGLGSKAWKLLPGRRRCRRRRARSGERASPLGTIRLLSDWPSGAADRSEPGHWEGDLIVGAANRTAAATLVERVSRHTLVVPLPHGYKAPKVAQAVTDALGRQPARLVRTLTWDQGREMARRADVEAALGIEVFFCDPHSPWQRPSNEQANGLLRRWLPKGTPLDLSPLRLSIIEDNLNWMPRRLHHWRSAADIYTQLTRNHR